MQPIVLTSWMRVNFSTEKVVREAVARLMNNLLSLAIRHDDEVGVWLDSSEKCVYFSPGATAAFAAVLTRLSLEQCNQPNLENLSLLYRYD
jgi:hypothetical protein